MNNEARRLTLDQIVAYNLREARILAGLKQAEAAELCARHLGVLWSVTVWSAAERSFDSGRVREFSAAEIAAFAAAFDLPIAWFLLPPDRSARIAARGADIEVGAQELLARLFPERGTDGDRLLGERLAELRGLRGPDRRHRMGGGSAR